jgi:hypothetical protein
MVKEVWNCAGSVLVRTEEATPHCWFDYCDQCGECLNCGGEMCINGGDHRWVEYECQEGEDVD